MKCFVLLDRSRNYFQGTAFAEWEVIDVLKFRTSWSYTNSNNKLKQFTSGENILEVKNQGFAQIYDRESQNWLGENTLSYSKIF